LRSLRSNGTFAAARESQDRPRSARFKLLFAPSAKAPAQLVDDFESAPRPNRWLSRSIIGDATFRKCADAQQLDANLACLARESMPCRIVYQLEYDHSEPPTLIRRQLQRLSSQDELDLSAIKLRSADRTAELTEIRRCVDRCVVFRHLQRAMDVGKSVEQVLNS
jgi:hypothetical protein